MKLTSKTSNELKLQPTTKASVEIRIKNEEKLKELRLRKKLNNYE